MPLTPASIESITLQAEDGIAISSGSEGVVKTCDILTGLCKASFYTPAKGSRWSDVQLINSMSVSAWSMKEEIHTWDVEKGETQMVVTGQVNVEDVRISGDGSKVFCLCHEIIQAW